MSPPAKLSHRHRAIAQWMLSNPGRSLRDCADELGYTQAWLSTVIHTDIFQAHIAELQHAADVIVVTDIPTQLRGIAALALTRLGETLEHIGETVADREYVKETTDMVLHRLGYAPRAALAPQAMQVENMQQNLYVLSKDSLADLRSRILTPSALPNLVEVEE